MTTAILLVNATQIYTITGSLSAVIYTDLPQAFIMIGGSAFIAWLGSSEAGEFSAVREALPDDFFHVFKEIDHPEYPWLGTTFGPLTGLVQIPFLNFSIGVFFGWPALFWEISKLDERPALATVAQWTVD
jgi:Na+/proline symporter